ncbi:MAG: hypothetical protein IJ759_03065 [Bacteroidales bacterium]|nr:hypothetical protein [Bacteroidales bacterium]
MWFKEDKILNGFLISLAVTVITVFVIMIIQRLLHADMLVHAKMFVFSVVPEILLLRLYSKKQMHGALKGSVLSLILTLGTVIVILMKYNYITM